MTSLKKQGYEIYNLIRALKFYHILYNANVIKCKYIKDIYHIILQVPIIL